MAEAFYQANGNKLNKPIYSINLGSDDSLKVGLLGVGENYNADKHQDIAVWCLLYLCKHHGASISHPHAIALHHSKVRSDRIRDIRLVHHLQGDEAGPQ